MSAKAKWSTPYYGMSHAIVGHRQLTVADHGDGFVTATLFPEFGTPNFWSRAVDKAFTTVEEARNWLEASATT